MAISIFLKDQYLNNLPTCMKMMFYDRYWLAKHFDILLAIFWTNMNIWWILHFSNLNMVLIVIPFILQSNNLPWTTMVLFGMPMVVFRHLQCHNLIWKFLNAFNYFPKSLPSYALKLLHNQYQNYVAMLEKWPLWL